MIGNVTLADRRDVEAGVSGEAEMRNPSRRNPIDPGRIQVSYSIPCDGTVHIRIGGARLDGKTDRCGRSWLTREFFLDESELPDLPRWVQDFVRAHHPTAEESQS